MTVLIIHLRLETPTIFTGISNGEENSSRTLPYIPGSALRGALVSRYLPSLPPDGDLPVDDEPKRLFFDGCVCYLNAYPTSDENWTRSLPKPASWRKRKDDELDGAEVADFALQTEERFDATVPGQFTAPRDGGGWFVFSPQERLLTHIGSDQRGEVKKGSSVVFQYQSLDVGQEFVAAILIKEKPDVVEIKKLLEQNSILTVGRSHSASYGRVRIIKVEEQENWSEAETDTSDGKTVITFLSDTILLDEYGQPTLDLDTWLEARLGRAVKRESAFIQPAVVGGFNRKWGLPLPQIPALGMGSVFVYDASQLAAEDVLPLVRDGIGDRRTEGFGRVVVNLQTQKLLTLHKKDNPDDRPKDVGFSASSRKLAAEMAERLLRRKLDSRLVEQVQHYSIKGPITNHQLSRLRGVVRAAISQNGNNAQKVTDFLNNLKADAQEQYRKPRVSRQGEGGQRLKDWLETRIADTDGLKLISFHETDVTPVAGVGTNLASYASEYTLRFIEALIDRRMKEKEE